ncbi:hypothetical protein [Frateuria aurantia]
MPPLDQAVTATGPGSGHQLGKRPDGWARINPSDLGGLGTRSGDYIMAYALPDSDAK